MIFEIKSVPEFKKFLASLTQDQVSDFRKKIVDGTIDFKFSEKVKLELAEVGLEALRKEQEHD